MSQAHTPGPWHFTDQLESKGQAIYTVGYTDPEGQRYHDIRFLPPVSDWREAHANARLISAAPELLNALELAQATIERLHRHAPESAQGTLDVVRAAIAKAKGEAL